MNDEQLTLWNGIGGHAWVELQELLDRILQPMEDLLVEAVPPGADRRVLDVGCGTGATTVGVARRLGARGGAVGIDLSDLMIGAARARAAREGSAATFVVGDVQTYPFEAASFDTMVSRFGVMFFDDPVQAFTNLRRAATEGAEMRFIAWRSAEENAFMMTAERAAAPLVPNVPSRSPGGPGQFSLADAGHVRQILRQSGWEGIDLQTVDAECKFPESELGRYVTRLGPVGRALHDADDRTRTQVAEAVRPAFAPYVHGGEVRFVAACWQIVARAQ